jgi:hypothetical protein
MRLAPAPADGAYNEIAIATHPTNLTPCIANLFLRLCAASAATIRRGA